MIKRALTITENALGPDHPDVGTMLNNLAGLHFVQRDWARAAVDPKALERDDGFLTASEIAGLKLDADWVILSACNTAGSSGETAETLSGIARAFFYAGARSLLVSHWEVSSNASVKLTTYAFKELKANPKIGRAEAFRLSMRELIEKGSLAEAHPSQWAPFVVVGEGGGEPSEATPLVTSSTAPPVAPLPARLKRPKKAVKAPDWRTEVWR